MNRNFAKLSENFRIEYAPTAVILNGAMVTNPTAETYLAAGYKPVTTAVPTDPAGEGKHWERDGWNETETAITAAWKAVDDPAPAPRQFSKLKLYGAIAALGAWDTIRAWLEEKTINGLNGWMAFQLAQEISENHPLFAPLAEEARQKLGLDEVKFETLLASCVLEGAE